MKIAVFTSARPKSTLNIMRIAKLGNKPLLTTNCILRSFGGTCLTYPSLRAKYPKTNIAIIIMTLASAVLVRKLQNPRLKRISFHTLRHWKATMLYHQTKDILYVKQVLGQKIETTILYTQLAETIFKDTNEELIVRAAKTTEEITKLLEVGFQYVCKKDGLVYFRKRK